MPRQTTFLHFSMHFCLRNIAQARQPFPLHASQIMGSAIRTRSCIVEIVAQSSSSKMIMLDLPSPSFVLCPLALVQLNREEVASDAVEERCVSVMPL